jgi:hypothetical protein
MSTTAHLPSAVSRITLTPLEPREEGGRGGREVFFDEVVGVVLDFLGLLVAKADSPDVAINFGFEVCDFVCVIGNDCGD